MKKCKPLRLVVILLCLDLAAVAETVAETVAEVSFNEQVVPLLKRHCVMCHMAGGAQGKFSLYPGPYLNIVAAPSSQSKLSQVEPGSLQNSYLFHKLTGTHIKAGGSGASMPYQRDSLPKTDIVTIRQWIKQGAKDN